MWLAYLIRAACMNNALQSGHNTSTRNCIAWVEFTVCLGKSMKYDQDLWLTVVGFQAAHCLLSPWRPSVTFVD